MVRDNQESTSTYWATHSSVCLFAFNALLFACSGLLASLTRSAALIYMLARSLTHSRACGKVNHLILEQQAVLNHSAEDRPKGINRLSDEKPCKMRQRIEGMDRETDR